MIRVIRPKNLIHVCLPSRIIIQFHEMEAAETLCRQPERKNNQADQEHDPLSRAPCKAQPQRPEDQRPPSEKGKLRPQLHHLGSRPTVRQHLYHYALHRAAALPSKPDQCQASPSSSGALFTASPSLDTS